MKSKECTLNNSELLKAVNDWISSLCETGGRSWSLRVPVDFNRDPDVLISELGKRFSHLEAENRELRDAIHKIAPWLSASLTNNSCKEYEDICNLIFKLDQRIKE